MKGSAPGTALITGASSGIGAVYADWLAHRGHDLILVARDRRRLETLAIRLSEDTGRSVEVLAADLNDKADLVRVEHVLRTNTAITVLVNNARIAMSGDLVCADPDHLDSMIRLNVLAPSRLALAAIPGFIARGQGTLINISSVLALAPERFNGSYSGTKAYLLNLSLRLQQEVASQGVRVQVVLPGATRTAIWEKAGTSIASLPPDIVMDVDDMVDAALAGLDAGETVTIPSLPLVRATAVSSFFSTVGLTTSTATSTWRSARIGRLQGHRAVSARVRDHALSFGQDVPQCPAVGRGAGRHRAHGCAQDRQGDPRGVRLGRADGGRRRRAVAGVRHGIVAVSGYLITNLKANLQRCRPRPNRADGTSTTSRRSAVDSVTKRIGTRSTSSCGRSRRRHHHRE